MEIIKTHFKESELAKAQAMSDWLVEQFRLEDKRMIENHHRLYSYTVEELKPSNISSVKFQRIIAGL